jgi:hypothetical protein
MFIIKNLLQLIVAVTKRPIEKSIGFFELLKGELKRETKAVSLCFSFL